MAPTIKWQRWDSASYDFNSTDADAALPQFEGELLAWIAAVNANPSNAGRQITQLKGYADSTAENYAGTVVRVGANNDTEFAYFMHAQLGSVSYKQFQLGPVYTDDGSNGGYGAISGGDNDTQMSWKSNGTEADWLIVYDTTDGQEFFCWGPRMGSSANYQDGFIVFKATNGEWTINTSDGTTTNQMCYHYFDDEVSTGWSSIDRTNNYGAQVPVATETFSRYRLYTRGTDSGSYIGRAYVTAANPSLFIPHGSTAVSKTAKRTVFTDLSPNNDVYMLSMYYFGPQVFVDLRS